MNKLIICGVVAFVSVLCAFAGPAVAQSGGVQRVYEQFQKAYDAGEFGEAVGYAERLTELLPENATAAYNAACVHALEGNADRAVAHLLAAGENGWSGIESYLTDPDLDSVRNYEGFAAALAAVRANKDKRFGTFQEAAESSELLTILPNGYDPKVPAPVLIALHGSGGTPAGMRGVYASVADELGMILVVPASHRKQGNGYGWVYRDEAEWMVLHCIERTAAAHAVDRERIVLTGFSQGANVTLQTGLKHAELFAGLVPVCGHWEPGITTIDPDGAENTRVALMIGVNDNWAHTFETAQQDLEAAGYKSTLNVYRNAGHAFPSNATHELGVAIRYVLGDD
jgi:predicted esterase